MAVENIPWMIQGGKHSAGTGRRVLFHATGGAEGISSIGDLRVQQQAVATGSIKVGPGSCVMVNRYPGASNESYDGKNASDTTVAIAPNASGSTRYDLVIARIDDWNYAGQQAVPGTLPTDTVAAFKLTVISGVSAATKTAKQLSLAYPAIALARIAIPTGTSAVTQAMITDLREKAVPRRVRNVNTFAVTGSTVDDLNVNGEAFPNAGSFTVEVPDWATQCRVNATWYGVRFPAGTTRYGTVGVRIGNLRADVINTQSTGFDPAVTNANTSRNTIGLVDTRAIPSTMRGASIVVVPMGYLTGGAGGYPSMDALSSVVIDLEWLEAPTEDV